jgi:very-short-patch-repair endonuclease
MFKPTRSVIPSPFQGNSQGGSENLELTKQTMHTPTRINPIVKQRSRRLRGSMTVAEQKLWSMLRKRQIGGFKFRRQHPLGSFILDFACLEAKLVIEVDGGQHADQQDYDKQRTDWLQRQGYHVIRFWNNEVLNDIEAVKEAIWRKLSYLPPSHPSP